MARLDLSTYLADDALTLEGVPSARYPDGKTYTVPSLSADDGVLLMQVLESGVRPGDAASPETLDAMKAFLKGPNGEQLSMREKLLGPALQELIADKATNNTIEALLGVLTVQASSGTESARMFVNRALGEAERPNRAARRAAGKPKTSTAAAGSKSSPTSGASRTQRTRTSTSARSTSAAPRAPRAKTA